MHKKSTTKGSEFKLTWKDAETKSIALATSLVNINANSEVFYYSRNKSDDLMVHNGVTYHDTDNDCLSLSLTFSERKDDQLQNVRSKFFAKYFLFDRNHIDLIEECIYTNQPFSRRMLFYYYVLMFDEYDLEKSDPKRVGLEEDKIILDFVISNLRSLDSQFLHTLKQEKERLSKETDVKKRNLITYKINQRELLEQVLILYNDEYNKLLKEDSL